MRLGKQETRTGNPTQTDSRKSLDVPIMVLKTDRNGGHKTFFGYAKNISRNGMMIGATSPREPGSRFVLEIPLPDPINRVITCKCEVVWRRRWSKRGRHEPGMGLRFLDLPEEVGAAIDRWIQSESLRAQLWN